MNLSDLPVEVLVALMQHVPLKERLLDCACLSSKIRKAAIGATTNIKHHAASRDAIHALQAYLHTHGAVVVNLDFKPPLAGYMPLPFALQQLPCPGLLKLKLTDTQVQLTAIPDRQQPGILSSCTALTSLCLLNCTVLDPSSQLGGLSVLQRLQDLVVKQDTDSSRRASQPLSLLPGSVLSQLVCLTRIHLPDTMRFASLEHLSCLTALQQCHVALAPGAQQERFRGVRQLQHLTSLQLDCHQSQQTIGYVETQGLYHATSLQELDVWACKAFRPTVVKRMGSLHTLIIRRTSLLGDANVSPTGTSRLLEVLPRLTALTLLDLTGTLQHHAVHLQDYTALTCLQNLSVLVLSDCSLPAGLWRKLAETITPMRSVRTLAINNSTAEPLDTDSLSSLVKCFPLLEDLSCVQSTQDGIQWAPLQQLPGLQAVRISGIRDADAPVLASLQHLTTLKIIGPSSITELGLLKLTALSRLEHLHVSGSLCSVLPNGGPGQCDIDIINKAPDGQVPNVAKQLLRMCIRSGKCQSMLLGQLGRCQRDLLDTHRELAAAKAELSSSKALRQVQRSGLPTPNADAILAQHRAELASVQAKADQVLRREAQVLAREVAVAKHEKELFELKKQHQAMQTKAQQLEQQQQQLKAQAEVEQQHLTTQTQHQQHLAHLAQQEQQLHARSMGLDVREKQVSASAMLLAARQHDFNKQLIAQAEAEQQHLTMQNQHQQHVAQQEQQLHGRTVGLDVRERQVSAAATLLAARQHDFNESYQPLSADLHSRLQQVAAREQQLSALQAQLGAQSQSLAMREQQLRQAQGVQQQAAQVPYTHPYGHPGSYR